MADFWDKIGKFAGAKNWQVLGNRIARLFDKDRPKQYVDSVPNRTIIRKDFSIDRVRVVDSSLKINPVIDSFVWQQIQQSVNTADAGRLNSYVPASVPVSFLNVIVPASVVGVVIFLLYKNR